jgi:hypothetical protein
VLMHQSGKDRPESVTRNSATHYYQLGSSRRVSLSTGRFVEQTVTMTKGGVVGQQLGASSVWAVFPLTD